MCRLPTPAIKHIVILNFATAILKVRKIEDVVSKAVGLTKDKKVLNQKRKVLVLVDRKLKEIEMLGAIVFNQMSPSDLSRVKKGHSAWLVSQIPEKTTSPEILALYMLFLNFQDLPDTKMSKLLAPALEIDYMELIITISEEIGLEKDVADEMYELALHLVEQIKK